MTTIDYSARLTLVSAAITAIVTGQAQSYAIDGQQVTKLDLPALMREEKRLAALVARQAGTRSAFSRIAPR